LGNQAELSPSRDWLLVFQEKQLRFEGYSWVQTQNCSKGQAIALNDYPKTAQLARNSAVSLPGIFRPSHSTGTRWSHL
jgi:hypothetical protein